MRRRDLLTKTPAVAAAMVVGGAVLDAEGSGVGGGHEGALGSSTAQGGSEGPGIGARFRLLEERDRPGVRYTMHPIREYVVECPYPVGSKAWLSVGDRDEAGNVVVCVEKGAFPLVKQHRRVLFPRFVLEGEGDLDERAEDVYRAVRERGFDSVKGDESAWRVVHVEFHCPDGVEHLMCGLPDTWDPRLCLGVMVKGQIGGEPLSTAFLDTGPRQVREWWKHQHRIEQLEETLQAVLDRDSDDDIIRGVLGDASWKKL